MNWLHFPYSECRSRSTRCACDGKKHEPPKDLPTGGPDVCMFGMTNYHNNFQHFGIKRDDRRRHLYLVGKSGTGKSKMLELLIQADINAGKVLVFRPAR